MTVGSNLPSHWWLIVPIITTIVSMGSAVVSAFLFYKFTHRHSLRSNAEKWLDCVRDDVSEFVALHWILCKLQQGDVEKPGASPPQPDDDTERGTQASSNTTLRKQAREWEKQRLALLVRLRLPLTKQEESPHKRLLLATNRLVAAEEGREHEAAQEDVLQAACEVVKREWAFIKTGKRPTDPAENYLG